MVELAVTMPLLGETVTEGTLTQWYCSVGDVLQVGDVMYSISTEKVDTEVLAEAGGLVTSLDVDEGATVEVGGRLLTIETEDAETSPKAGSPSTWPPPLDSSGAAPTETIPAGGTSDTNAETSVLRIVALPPRPAHRQVDPSVGRDNPARPTTARIGSVTPTSGSTDGRWLPHGAMRRTIATRMRTSIDVAAHTLVVMEADYEAVHRARMREPGRPRLSYLPFVCRAVVEAVRAYPKVNSHVHDDGLEVFDRIRMGVAVDLDQEGLVVPVIADAGALRLRAIGERIEELAHRARTGGLSVADTSAGTLTITNSGGRGSLLGRPIINLPQSVIVETDLVEQRVVAGKGRHADEVVIHVRRRGYLSMSYDHRAFDGAYACGFLAEVCSQLQNRDWSIEDG